MFLLKKSKKKKRHLWYLIAIASKALYLVKTDIIYIYIYIYLLFRLSFLFLADASRPWRGLPLL